MGTLAGKIAWITGAGSGIGLAGAHALAEAGATVVLSGRRAGPLDEAVAAIAAAGGRAETLALDVTNADAVQAAAAGIADRHGRVDILVNNAGSNAPNRYWKNMTPADWNFVVGVNLNGPLYCTQAVLPGMRARRDGLVINIASWAGKFDTLLTGPAYNATKHGLVSMTMSLNIEECVNGIRGTVICPGEVATPIMQKRPVPPSAEEMARMLKPEDLGRTIRFVAEMPPHACVHEILMAPTWNRMWLGGDDLPKR
ncbi:NADP-dependent 3-hydroxy acid dehydrogenase YdfG [Stella humosa]|uniref:NADP-dependent 3-hydroxy acid dehydrogenase YdfG n=1 Tax=Stella humosa TaxID=94 RepID=A0A3N1LGL4_9PROT|nr:SDR family oxidoreductase [Stella humosa]ROP90552.1 NADP-dependent 3-hydroxy acid dehydrogenase YdfG [Stella humosa]BBK29553.1 oxidoreductase [Stella humosa]